MTLVAPAVPAVQPPGLDGAGQTTRDQETRFGFESHLKEHLFAEHELERLLNSVRRPELIGSPADVVAVYRRLFDAPADSLIPAGPSPEDGRHSLRREAIRRLLVAGPGTLQAWRTIAGDAARQELTAALAAGNPAQLSRVAWSYPLTDAGEEALTLTAVAAIERGNFRIASQLLEQLRQMDVERTATPALRRRLRVLAERLHGLNTAPANPSEVTASYSVPMTMAAEPVSRAWPGPLWTHTESVWDLNDNHDVPVELLELMLESQASPTEVIFNNWPALIRGDQVIHRSPLQITGHDRLTGRQLWSLRTDTFSVAEEIDLLGDFDPRPAFSSDWNSTDQITANSEFGILSTDAHRLYFIDHFDLMMNTPQLLSRFDRVQRFGGAFGRRALPEFPAGEKLLHPRGDRIVALELRADGGLPHVLWTIGSTPPSPYRVSGRAPAEPAGARGQTSDATTPVVTGAGGEPMESPVLSSSAPADATGETSPGSSETPGSPEQEPREDSPFAGHEFLCVPLGALQRLYVLSHHEDAIWINCLAAADGSLLWRRPLVYESMQGGPLGPPENSSVLCTCLNCNGTIVCALSSGFLCAVDALDGTQKWACCLRGQSQAESVPSRGNVVSSWNSSYVFAPVTDGQTIIWATPHSSEVFAVSVDDGRILWRRVRFAFGAGITGQRIDLSCAGIVGRQVILIGAEHCRALSLDDGIQNWVVPLQYPTGRPLCGAGYCLVPELSGHVCLIDLATGTADRTSPRLQFSAPQSVFGALSEDADVLCAATPMQIKVFPRADLILRQLDQLEPMRDAPERRALTRAQALLLSGRRDASMDVLLNACDAGFTQTADEDAVRRIRAMAAELLMDDIALLLFPATPVTGPAGLDDADPPVPADVLQHAATVEQMLRQLSRLPLQPASLNRRRAVLTSVCCSVFGEALHGIEPPQLTPELLSSVFSVDDDWDVRAELLRRESEPHAQIATIQDLPQDAAQLRTLAESVILFPELMADDAVRFAFCERLLHQGDPIAAAMVMSVLRGEDVETPPAEWLSRLGQQYPRLAAEPEFQVDGTVTPEVRVPQSLSAVITEEIHIRPADPMVEEVGRTQSQSDLPRHPQYQLTFQRESESEAGAWAVTSWQMSSGARIGKAELPFSSVQAVRRAERNSSALSLFTVMSDHEIAMMSLDGEGDVRQLWTQSATASDSDSVLAGPMGTQFAVWQTGTRLYCSHPLTGRELWSRRAPQPARSPFMTSEFRLFGDEAAVVLMGADAASYQCYATRDGRPLGHGRLEIGRAMNAVTVGRKLLYAGAGGRLILFDPLTRSDELADEPPVEVSAIGPGQLVRLTGDRVLTITAQHELILIDCRAGNAVFRTPIRDRMNTRFVFSLTAFERHGQLFAAVHDEQEVGGMQESATPGQVGEVRLDYGSLLCLDPQTGAVRWHTRTQPSICPRIFGDPCEHLILWSVSNRTVSPDEQQHLRRQLRGAQMMQASPRMRVTVIDEVSGATIASADGLTFSMPVRTVHMADRHESQLVTVGSVIHIEFAQATDDSL